MGHVEDKANDRAKQAARKQRRFTKMMYENRYQMTMADMHNAGLNPILAYQQGVGSPGAGAMAATPMGDSDSALIGAIGSLGSAAASGSQASSAKKLRNKQGLLTLAQTTATDAAGRQSDSQTRLNDAAQIGAVHNARTAAITADFLELERPKRERQAAFEASMPGRVMGHIGRGAELLGPAVTGAAGFFMGRGMRAPRGNPVKVRIGGQDKTRFGGTKGMTAKEAAQYEKWMNTYKVPRPGPNYRGRGK